jgi:hypothetical protein
MELPQSCISEQLERVGCLHLARAALVFCSYLGEKEVPSPSQLSEGLVSPLATHPQSLLVLRAWHQLPGSSFPPRPSWGEGPCP